MSELPALDFQQLIAAIQRAHHGLQAAAVQAVNTALTLRNWVVGHQIHHYEQHGADRARHGSRLLETLAERLQTELDRAYTGRYLGLCRQFHAAYPTLGKSLISDSDTLPVSWKSLISDTPAIAATEAGAPQAAAEDVPARLLLSGLSFTHFIELIKCADPLQRRFYEVESLQGQWYRPLSNDLDTWPCGAVERRLFGAAQPASRQVRISTPGRVGHPILRDDHER